MVQMINRQKRAYSLEEGPETVKEINARAFNQHCVSQQLNENKCPKIKLIFGLKLIFDWLSA